MNNPIRSSIVKKLNAFFISKDNNYKKILEQTKKLLIRKDTIKKIKDDEELDSLVDEIYNIIKNNYFKER